MDLQFGTRLFCAWIIALMPACNFLPDSSSGAFCQRSDGSYMNTHSIYGTWKKVSGYTPSRSDAQLKENYDVLIFLRNGQTCRVEFVNAAQTNETKEFYDYIHDIDQKRIDLLSTSGESEYSVRYRFAGSCGNTQMTWTGDDGSVETFVYRSQLSDEVTCAE